MSHTRRHFCLSNEEDKKTKRKKQDWFIEICFEKSEQKVQKNLI